MMYNVSTLSSSREYRMSIEAIKVHLLKESGLSFSAISSLTGIALQSLPSMYVDCLVAKKQFEINKTKDPVVYRKRFNKVKTVKFTTDIIDKFKRGND